MAFEITWLAWRALPETQARARVARCQESWWSTSATEISNFRRRRSLSPFRTCRLPLSDSTSGRWISTVPTATRAADMSGRGARSEGSRHLFGGKGLDEVPHLHALDAVDADPALE